MMFSMFLDFYSKKKAVPGRNSLRVFADLGDKKDEWVF
jgi:hypothetical protein